MYTRLDKIADDMNFLGLYGFTDLAAVIFAGTCIFGFIGDMIYPPLKIWFQVCASFLLLFWMLPTPNQGQKNISTLTSILKKDRTIYTTDTQYTTQEEAIAEENLL